MKDQKSALRALPSVQKLLTSAGGEELIARYGRGVVAYGLRAALGNARVSLTKSAQAASGEESLLSQAEAMIRAVAAAEGRRAINAAGIVLHTGLGRAPLSRRAQEALATAGGYSIVEIERESGERTKREIPAESLLRELTGCESATVVNNCAAAIYLVLAAIAKPGEVVISRGQLVEIGGSYRMPDVMEASGCVLREVGTTNRTSIDDYRKAITERTSAILVVSQSNFRIRGFTDSPSLAEICALGRERSLPVLYDLGGGSLRSLARYGVSHETTVPEAIQAGVEAVCFSGDKLIGGPQAGIICGKRDAIARARKNVYYRMFRPDKLCLAALEASLVSFLNETFEAEIPVYQMISTNEEELRGRAERLAAALGGIAGARASVIEELAYLGGGSLPDEALPSVAVRLESVAAEEAVRNRWASAVARALRTGVPAVFGKLDSAGLVFHLRTVFPGEDAELEACIRNAAGSV